MSVVGVFFACLDISSANHRIDDAIDVYIHPIVDGTGIVVLLLLSLSRDSVVVYSLGSFVSLLPNNYSC